MTRAETIATLETLMSAWPNYRLTDATIVLWCQKFAQTDRANAYRATELLIDNNENFPTVAEMRAALHAISNRPRPYEPHLELDTGSRLTNEEAWERIAEMKAKLGAQADGIRPRPVIRTPNEDDELQPFPVPLLREPDDGETSE